MISSSLYWGWGLHFTAGVRNTNNCRQTFLEGLSFPGPHYPPPLLYIIHSKINLLIVPLHSSDPLLGLLLLRGAGGHGGVAVGGPSHPPPHTWTEPLIWLEGDASSGMTSLWRDPTQTEPAALPKTAVTHHRLNKKKKTCRNLPALGRGARQREMKRLPARRWEVPNRISLGLVFINVHA